MQPTRHLPSRDRLSVLTAIILLGFALSRFLDLPTRSYGTTLLGSPLGIELNGPVLMLVLVAALISAGADSLIRSHPARAARPGESTAIHWILPGATAVVLGAALNQLPTGPSWWLGLGLTAVALIMVLVAEYTVVDRADPAWDLATLGLTALVYILALILFALLRSLSARALVSASMGGMLAGTLAGRLFALKAVMPSRATLYAGVVGVVVAEAIWAINYWRALPSSAGLLAMIPFYLAVGLAQQHLTAGLTRRIWLEYVIVGGLGLAIALAYTFG